MSDKKEITYDELLEALSKVEDDETKQHVINLIKDGFAPLILEKLGRS